ncbi:uncharacterized protein [Epargyreus clarus]|uniref:uncharacterized protein n=1 Tax=Epargyreus clarus TaxID=520877 RepID=UPI003C2D841C
MAKNINTRSLVWGCCENKSDGGNFLTCTLCKKAFHCACLVNSDDTRRPCKSWTCPICSGKSHKIPRDDNTPIRLSSNVTIRGPKRQALISPPNIASGSACDMSTAEIIATFQQVIQNELSSVVNTLKSMISVTISSEAQSLKEELKSQYEMFARERNESTMLLENLKVENLSMRQTIVNLEARLRHLEQSIQIKEQNIAIIKEKTHTLDDLPSNHCYAVPQNDSSHSEIPKDPVTNNQAHASQLISSLKSDDGHKIHVPKKQVSKQSRRPVSLQGAAGPNITTLKAVQMRRFLHLWNMESNINEIREYLRIICGSDICTVEELVPKGNYRSFKIGVPIEKFDICYSTEAWPLNARLKIWINYKKSTPRRKIPSTATTSDQPFRSSRESNASKL